MIDSIQKFYLRQRIDWMFLALLSDDDCRTNAFYCFGRIAGYLDALRETDAITSEEAKFLTRAVIIASEIR